MLIKKISFWLPFLLLLAIGLTTQAQGITIPSNTGLPDGNIAGVLITVLNWLLMVFVIIATISFVITGLQFIFSFGGASGSEAQAKKNFSYTIIAIFIVGGSLIILKTIVGLLGPSSGGNSGSGINYGTEQNPNYGTVDDNYGDTGGMMNPTPINSSETPASPGTTNTPSSGAATNIPSPVTTNPNATAGDDGGIYVPEGVHNQEVSNGGTTSNPSATAGEGGAIYRPEGL